MRSRVPSPVHRIYPSPSRRAWLLGAATAVAAASPLGRLVASAEANLPIPEGVYSNWSDVGYHRLGPAAIPTRSATFTFGPGRHTMTDRIVLRSGQILRGAGREATILYFPKGLIGMGYPPTRGDIRNKWDWNGAVIETDGTEIGIEDLTIEFGPHPYHHHAGQGYSGIYFQPSSRDCWVRNVAIINADDALHFNGSACTAIGICIIGGHHLQIAFTAKGHNLAHDIEISGESHHGLTGNWGANHNVFSRVRSLDGRIRVEPNHNGPTSFDLLYSDIVNADPALVPIGGAPPAIQPGATLMWNVSRYVCSPPDLYVAQMRQFCGIDLEPSESAPPPSGPSTVDVNVGGNAYTARDGVAWSADQPYRPGRWGYVGGQTWHTRDPIGNTSDDPLYQAVRYGNFRYRFDVPNGRYDVTLHFAEVYHGGPRQRLFDVVVQGKLALDNFDPYAAAPGHDVATAVALPDVTVTDGHLLVDFVTVRDNAIVSAISIQCHETDPAPSTPTTSYAKYVNVGGGDCKDARGNLWCADQAYSRGSWGYVDGQAYRTWDRIRNTSDSELYQTVRYGTFRYQFDVPDGTYDLRLHFAEVYWTAAGQRVFDVRVQNRVVLNHYDIYAVAGHDGAVVQTIEGVIVAGGRLVIEFASIRDYAMVSGICIHSSAS